MSYLGFKRSLKTPVFFSYDQVNDPRDKDASDEENGDSGDRTKEGEPVYEKVKEKTPEKKS